MPCECVECCDGEHPGRCKECAGWGSNNEEDVCSHCDGEGVCPKCDGKSEFVKEFPDASK